MQQRARSATDKARRGEALLLAARDLSSELGGARHVTLAAVSARAGLHPSGVRRYFASKEELLLELAERGWSDWRDAIESGLERHDNLGPSDVADLLTGTLASLPTFCDLLTHVPLSLEGDVRIERARSYKTSVTAAYDEIVDALIRRSSFDRRRVEYLLAASLALAAYLWQLAHPTPTLAQLYVENPGWAHTALDFEDRLRTILGAVGRGL